MIAARESFVLALGLSLLVAAPARAEDRRPRALLVDVGACAQAQIDAALFGERLHVELHADGVEEVRLAGRGAPLSSAPEDVWIVRLELERCETGAEAFAVRIEDRRGRALAEHRADVGGAAPSARERALALALAELLRATSPSAEAEPVEGAEPPAERAEGGAAIGEGEVAAGDEPDRTAAFSAAFVVRAFPGGRVAPLGARLAADIELWAPLVVRIDAEVGAGMAFDPLGAIELGLATGGVGLAWAARAGGVRVLLGARLAAGVGWAQGQPYDAGTPSHGGAGPIVTAGAMLELDVRVAGPLALRFGAEAGAVAGGLEARVGAIPVAGITGAMLAAWAGVAFTD